MLSAHELVHAGHEHGRPVSDGLGPGRANRVASLPSLRTALGGTWAYIPTAAAGIGLMGLGLLLSWVSVITPIANGIHRTGLDTSDGRFIAVAAVLLALLVGRELHEPGRANRALLLTISVGVATVLWYDWHDLLHRISGLDSDLATAGVGPGLFLTALGVGLLALAVTLRAHRLAPGALAADVQRVFAEIGRRWLGLARWKQVVAITTGLTVLIGGPVGRVRLDAIRHSPFKDAVMGDCSNNDVTVTITNKTSTTADYLVTVKLVDVSGREVSHDTVRSTNLEPARSTEQRIQNLNFTQPWKSCVVDAVTRTAS
jgi:hypothetical protein